MTLRVAAAAYTVDRLANVDAYAAKLTDWVAAAARRGAQLAVFPEYAGLELAGLTGAGGLAASIDAVATHLSASEAVLDDLARRHAIHICAGSAPVRLPDGRVVNRVRLYAPTGAVGTTDKLILTPYERDPWGLSPGDAPTVFDTALGRIGVAICYDSEFPLIARAMVAAGAEILLIPSATDTPAGHTRVEIAARARALEGQIATIQAPLIGAAPWCEAVDVSFGAAGIYVPPDHGLPDDGTLARGGRDTAGWVFADIDLARLADVRRNGQVRLAAHWPEQDGRLARVGLTPLR